MQPGYIDKTDVLDLTHEPVRSLSDFLEMLGIAQLYDPKPVDKVQITKGQETIIGRDHLTDYKIIVV
jgi:hypothetical protein